MDQVRSRVVSGAAFSCRLAQLPQLQQSATAKSEHETLNRSPESRKPCETAPQRTACERCISLILGCALLAFSAIPARAQVRSNIAGVNLAAILNDSISVSASPGQVNFVLPANGVVTGNPTLVITTAWILKPAPTLQTFAYFSSSASALSDGAGHNIPSSSVSGSVNGGAFQTFTGACVFSANTCLTVFNLKVTGNQKTGINNTNLQLQISTVGLKLPAGTYTGVLNIRAQAL